MNYIRHLNAFYEKLAADERFSPCHISLYLALFQCWNMNHFENPFSINRAQLFKLSKIGSNHTYYNVLRDLNLWGYIQYLPSRTRQKGALINMCIFAPILSEILPDPEIHLCKNAPCDGAEMHQNECNSASHDDAKMHPSLNNININNKTLSDENSKSQIPGKEVSFSSEGFKSKKLKIKKTENKNYKSGESSTVNNRLDSGNNTGREQNHSGAGNKIMIRPSLIEVIDFFKSENYPEIEAQKFFNHFESNGWKVGGKAPMKNWHAAARNWMLNCGRFIPPQDFPKPKEKPKPGPNNKNYSEPL